MANPVTSILNPTGDRMLLYWVDKHSRLALKQIPVTENQHPVAYKPRSTPDGNLITNQVIAAVNLLGIPVVFGRIFKPDPPKTDVKADPKADPPKVTGVQMLGQLSPIVNILAVEDEDSRADTMLDPNLPGFAAVSDNEHTAWFYYLKIRQEGAHAQLMEAKLTYDVVTVDVVEELKGANLPDKNTRLSAVYVEQGADKGQRDVFFQKEGANDIWCLRIGSHLDPVQVLGTTGAAAQTPMAVAKSMTGNVYLYYLSNTKPPQIQRATRTATGWTPSPTIMSNIEPNRAKEQTQIAAVSTEDGSAKQNFVFFINDSNEDYQKNLDQVNVE